MDHVRNPKDPAFEQAKKFSDFIGFHVRFIFCGGAAWFALLIPISAFLTAKLNNQNYNPDSHIYEIIAFFAIASYALALLFFILRSVRNYFWNHTLPLVRKLRWVFIALFFGVEVSFIIVLSNLILHETLKLVELDRDVSLCLMDEWTHEIGIAMEPRRAGCNDLLATARQDPPDPDPAHGTIMDK